jgi:hypothetical protein
MVVTDTKGAYSLEYCKLSDPLIRDFLKVRSQTGCKHPILGRVPGTLRRLAYSLPFSPNLTRGEFIPTATFDFIRNLHRHFPRHRLVLSDFYHLPDTTDDFIMSPVVQTRWKRDMIPCSTFLVKPGLFDIFFPTDFELLRDIYSLVETQERSQRIQGAQDLTRLPKVCTHHEFLEKYANLSQTRTACGENPLLGFYENVKFLVT